MAFSLQTKFLIMCTTLVLLATLALSGTYYILVKKHIRRGSRQQIRIAFDIILGDFTNRSNTYAKRLHNFLAEETSFSVTTLSYMKKEERIRSTSFLTNYLTPVADKLKRLGHDMVMDRLALYAADPQKRLLAVYQRVNEEETSGAYVVSETGNDTYFPMKDSQRMTMLVGSPKIEDTPLPPGIAAHHEGDIPDKIFAQPISEGQSFGIRITAPVYQQEEMTGVLIGDVFYTQEIVRQYASLSKTEVSFFVGDQSSISTFDVQTHLSAPESLDRIGHCEDILQSNGDIEVLPAAFNDQKYYQGQCAFKDARGAPVTIIINLSQDIEKQANKEILTAMLTVSGIVIGVAVGLSLILNHKPNRTIRNILGIIRTVAEGDLRELAAVMSRDEFGRLAIQLNRMIKRLRTIVGQVQRSGIQVTSSATELSATARQQEASMTHQVESTKHVLNSVEHISTVVSDLAQTMHQVASMSQETAQFASSSRTDLARMQEAMQHMEDASESISGRLHTISEKANNITNMVTTITKVADQTNLLSLNAAIEAEKAGEYGRGFTVVAREIRRLADQTAVATLDIEQMVQEMQSAVSAGVMEMEKFIAEVRRSAEDVEKIGTQLTRIIEQVQALTPNFEDVNGAMGEQSASAQEINNAMLDLNEEIQQTSDSLRESFLAIEQLNEAAKSLKDEVSLFKVS